MKTYADSHQNPEGGRHLAPKALSLINTSDGDDSRESSFSDFVSNWDMLSQTFTQLITSGREHIFRQALQFARAETLGVSYGWYDNTHVDFPIGATPKSRASLFYPNYIDIGVFLTKFLDGCKPSRSLVILPIEDSESNQGVNQDSTLDFSQLVKDTITSYNKMFVYRGKQVPETVTGMSIVWPLRLREDDDTNNSSILQWILESLNIYHPNYVSDAANYTNMIRMYLTSESHDEDGTACTRGGSYPINKIKENRERIEKDVNQTNLLINPHQPEVSSDAGVVIRSRISNKTDLVTAEFGVDLYFLLENIDYLNKFGRIFEGDETAGDEDTSDGDGDAASTTLSPVSAPTMADEGSTSTSRPTASLLSGDGSAVTETPVIDSNATDGNSTLLDQNATLEAGEEFSNSSSITNGTNSTTPIASNTTTVATANITIDTEENGADAIPTSNFTFVESDGNVASSNSTFVESDGNVTSSSWSTNDTVIDGGFVTSSNSSSNTTGGDRPLQRHRYLETRHHRGMMEEHLRVLLHHRRLYGDAVQLDGNQAMGGWELEQNEIVQKQNENVHEDCGCFEGATKKIFQSVATFLDILYRRFITLYYHPKPTRSTRLSKTSRVSTRFRTNSRRSLRLGLGVDTSMKTSDRDHFVVFGGNVPANYTCSIDSKTDPCDGGIELTWDEYFYYVELKGKGKETLYVVDQGGLQAGSKLKSALVYYFPALSSEEVKSLQTTLWTVDDVIEAGGYPAYLSFMVKSGVVYQETVSLYVRDPKTSAPIDVPSSATSGPG